MDDTPRYRRIERRVELHSPDSEVEALLLKSILDAAGIDYFVKNDTFGSLTIGPQIAHYNRKTFLVAEHQVEEARALIGEFLHKTVPPRPQEYRLWDKLRMVFEVLLFGWFLPGGRRRNEPQLRLIHGARPSGAEPRAAHRREGHGQRSRRGPPLRLIRCAPEEPETAAEPSSGAESRPRTPGR